MNLEKDNKTLYEAFQKQDMPTVDSEIVRLLLEGLNSKEQAADVCAIALKRLGYEKFDYECIKNDHPSDCWMELLIHELKTFIES